MAQLLEAIMMICFGISWPISIAKSWKAKTTKGKSVVFISLILLGYTCGIISKIVSNNITYVLILYCINWVSVAIELILYYRNLRYDKKLGDTLN